VDRKGDDWTGMDPMGAERKGLVLLFIRYLKDRRGLDRTGEDRTGRERMRLDCRGMVFIFTSLWERKQWLMYW
jgi:hypothetical protein